MRALALLLCCLFLSVRAHAHEVRPSFLELTESAPGEWAAVWKQPITNGQRLKIDPVFPSDCEQTEPTLTYSNGTLLKRWTIHCALDEGEIEISGLTRTLTDTFIRIKDRTDVVRSAVLRGGDSSFSLSEKATGAPVLAYLKIGIEHIVFGYDHLLFALGLVLLVPVNRLLVTITAFTIAHSITLGAAVLFGLTLPGAPVEIVIAMSIVLLAVEALRAINGEPSYSARFPWLIAFGFGLVHGFGFAGALSDIGLPESARLVSLGLFNLGVEVGQIFCVMIILLAGVMLQRSGILTLRRAKFASAYFIGIAGSVWTIERMFETFLPGAFI